MTDERLDRLLDAQLSQLPRDLPPQRDLWLDIAGRIDVDHDAYRRASHTTRRSWREAWWGQLAAASVLIAVTAVVTWQIAQPPPSDRLAGALELPVIETPPATPASFGRGPVLESGYVEARAILTRTFEQRLAELPPATRHKVERNLAEIRRASAELAAALEEHPANPLLQDLLVSTYQDELALFSQVNMVTAPTHLRNDL